MSKQRLDQLLVSRGLFESREKAQRGIRAGLVRVQGRPAGKPGVPVPEDADIELLETERFVSRGGEKLLGALQHWPEIHLQDSVCLDLGASTGGFTDCMLQHGARLVYAVDVGKGQLHWKLRQDTRVKVMEQVNARYLDPDTFHPRPGFCSVDVSFISLEKVLPAAHRVLTPGGELVSLIKPQFEAGRDQVGQGVVTDPRVHHEVVERIRAFGTAELGWNCLGVIPSPLKGPKGNTEFLAYWRLPA